MDSTDRVRVLVIVILGMSDCTHHVGLPRFANCTFEATAPWSSFGPGRLIRNRSEQRGVRVLLSSFASSASQGLLQLGRRDTKGRKEVVDVFVENPRALEPSNSLLPSAGTSTDETWSHSVRCESLRRAREDNIVSSNTDTAFPITGEEEAPVAPVPRPSTSDSARRDALLSTLANMIPDCFSASEHC